MLFGKTTRISLAASAFAVAIAMSSPMASATDETSDSVDAADVRAEIAESVDAIGAYTAEQRDVAVAAAEKTLADIDTALDRFENNVRENWNDLSDEAQAEASTAMETLRQERNEFGEHVAALKSGADDAWDDLVNGFTDAWAEFESAWEDTDETPDTSL